jgi:hypothetical protein
MILVESSIGLAMASDERPRRHPNVSEKHALRVAGLARHVKAAGRKAQKRTEPNDRKHSPEFAKKLRRLPPTELDRLLRDDEAD